MDKENKRRNDISDEPRRRRNYDFVPRGRTKKILEDVDDEKPIEDEVDEELEDEITEDELEKIEDVIDAENKESLFNKIFKKNKEKDNEGVKEILEPPVDLYKHDNGNVDIYFNINKYLSFIGKDWINRVFGSVRLYNLTVNMDFLDAKAKSIYQDVAVYNSLTSSGQKKYNKNKKKAKIINRLYIIIITIFLFYFMFLPLFHESQAYQSLESQNFEKAQMHLLEANNTATNSAYLEYVNAMVGLKDAKFKKGLETIDSLIERDLYLPAIDLKESRNEIIYQQAMYFYHYEEYYKAYKMFKKIYDYKDSKEHFNESGYLAIDSLIDEGKYKQLGEIAYLLKDYKDVSEKIDEVNSNMYTDGMVAYSEGKYDKALEIFEPLAVSNYKNSKTMIYHSKYNDGLEKYKSKDYVGSIKALRDIEWFKDSSALLSEMYYLAGKSVMNKEPAKAYNLLVYNIAHRDTIELLKQPQMIMYGKWKVVEANGSVISPKEFTFTVDNTIVSEDDIKFVDTNGAVYEYQNGQYISDTGVIKVEVNDINNIIIHASDKDDAISYTLVRNSYLSKTVSDINKTLIKDLDKFIDKKVNYHTYEKKIEDNQDSQEKENSKNVDKKSN